MPNRIDFIRAVARAALSAGLYREWLTDGRQQGAEWSSRESSLSVNTATGAWGRFSEGGTAAEGSGGGDLVGLWAYLQGYDLHDKGTMSKAADELADRLGMQPFKAERPSGKPPPHPYEPFRHPKLGVPEKVFVFEHPPIDGARGRAVAAECLWFPPGQTKTGTDKPKKVTLPFNLTTGAYGKPKGERIPLYNTPAVVAAPEEQIILVVEGAKCASFLKGVLVKAYGRDPRAHPFVPTAWMGGTAAASILGTDWRAVQGRRVVVVPDCDEPGRKAALAVGNTCQNAGAASVAVLDPGDERPEKWDLGDWDQSYDGPFPTMWDALLGKAVDFAAYREEREARDAALGERVSKIAGESIKWPFTPLGYHYDEANGGNVYDFYSPLTQNVVSLAPKELNETNLLEIAPLEWWDSTFGHTDKDGNSRIPWRPLGNIVREAARRRGVFDLTGKRRGVGCWRVGDRDIAIHTGPEVLIGNKWVTPAEATVIASARSGAPMLFQAEAPVELPNAPKADYDFTGDLARALRVVDSFNFRAGKLGAELFVGWCLAAMFCGVFKWRPHLMVTGPAGSGKTTLMRVGHHLLGPWAFRLESKTTEPGVRKKLCFSARPLVMDEFESQGTGSAARHAREIRKLLRAAASESGGEIVHGDGRSYRPRTMAMLGGIVSDLQQEADVSRHLLLELNPPTDTSRDALVRWRRDLDAHLGQLPKDIWAKFFWFLYLRRIPFLSAVKAFEEAAAMRFRNARRGDLMAAPLAAIYAVGKITENTHAVSREEAGEYLARLDAEGGFSAVIDDHAQTDAEQFLTLLLSIRTRQHYTIGHAVNELRRVAEGGQAKPSAFHRTGDFAPEPQQLEREYDQQLGAYGLKVARGDKESGLLLANQGFKALDEAMRDTQWASAASRKEAARRLPDARSWGKLAHFSTSGSSRATVIPLDALGALQDPDPFLPSDDDDSEGDDPDYNPF